MTKKILVADNSITIQKIVAMAFEKENTIVEGISNGKDALDRIKIFKPDIVLADVDMSGLTGFELSKKIKKDPELKTTKVLLLASDFGEFNEDLFTDSGADDHISKPFKSEDIIKRVADLLLENTPNPTDETINLTAMDLDESIKSTDTAIELSAENLVKEEDPTVELSTTDLEESADSAVIKEVPIELSAENLVKKEDPTVELSTTDLEESANPAVIKEMSNETERSKNPEEDLLDLMIEDVESLKKTVAPLGADYDELSDEVNPTREDEIGDELDMAFQEIANFGTKEKQENLPNIELQPPESSTADSIIPEPEDLLEKMTTSVLGGTKGLTGPNLIQESLSYLSQISHESKSRQAMTSQRSDRLKDSVQSSYANDDPVEGEQVRNTLQDEINTSIEKEIAELSKSITQSVREVVREITPKIARDIIKEEIDKIKKS